MNDREMERGRRDRSPGESRVANDWKGMDGDHVDNDAVTLLSRPPVDDARKVYCASRLVLCCERLKAHLIACSSFTKLSEDTSVKDESRQISPMRAL